LQGGRANINKGKEGKGRKIGGFNSSVEENGIVEEVILLSLNAVFCRGNTCEIIATLM
jgi:hypothetical protein